MRGLGSGRKAGVLHRGSIARRRGDGWRTVLLWSSICGHGCQRLLQRACRESLTCTTYPGKLEVGDSLVDTGPQFSFPDFGDVLVLGAEPIS